MIFALIFLVEISLKSDLLVVRLPMYKKWFLVSVFVCLLKLSPYRHPGGIRSLDPLAATSADKWYYQTIQRNYSSFVEVQMYQLFLLFLAIITTEKSYVFILTKNGLGYVMMIKLFDFDGLFAASM
jgi:hypothetical protein